MFIFSKYKIRKFIGGSILLGLLLSLQPLSMVPSVGRRESIDSLETTAVISPSLSFSTFFGGIGYNYGYYGADDGKSIAVASDGSCYVIGTTWSDDFPTLNAYDNTFEGSNDAFVAKFSTYGSLLWSTFFGGSNMEWGLDIGVASDGSCYVTGNTWSSDFPTLNAYDNTFNGGDYDFDAFLAKFSTNGSLLWSTYLGGNGYDFGYAVAIASDDSCYVTGCTASSNFPTLNAYDNTFNGGMFDVFIAKFSMSGSLLWSTFLGGSGYTEYGKSIAVASDDSCYVTGLTDSSDFPMLNAYDSTLGGDGDAFVTKFSTSGSLLWSTYLGGNDWDECGYGIAVASDGSCYVTGDTWSSNFPTLNAYDSILGGEADAFLAKFSTSGSLLWSTFLGGSDWDEGSDIAIDSNGNCYVTGCTDSSDFPIQNAYDSTYNNGNDVFVTKLSTAGSLLWSTYFGGSDYDKGTGIAVTSDESCYIIGSTNSSDFPTQNAYDNTYNGGPWDAFVTKLFKDLTEPIIRNIKHTPMNPTTKDNITFTCIATDECGIQSVTLYYRVNNGTWATIVMTLGALNTYQAILNLSFKVDDIVEYYFEAVDNSPNNNVAIDNNDGQFYKFTITKTQGSSAYSFLTFLIVMPIITYLLKKRRK
ncbi:MAG TPA: SBBP repeat-containing protein [candidate division Zixibacteria bacterium]|nr:SBBP repeat-containing protein [candidate division Zixibacteria bacterium]